MISAYRKKGENMQRITPEAIRARAEAEMKSNKMIDDMTIRIGRESASICSRSAMAMDALTRRLQGGPTGSGALDASREAFREIGKALFCGVAAMTAEEVHDLAKTSMDALSELVILSKDMKGRQ